MAVAYRKQAMGYGLWERMSKKGFRELVVWQRSKELAVEFYGITSKGSLAQDFGLRDQMRRSVVSIASNIAEGDERDTDRESIRFFFIAKGSLGEFRTQMEIAYEVGYLAESKYRSLESRCEEIGKMIGALIKKRLPSPSP